MTPIRPSAVPPPAPQARLTPSAGQAPSGQGGIFALARAKMAEAAQAAEPAPAAAAAPAQKVSAVPADPPQKILRPGSLIDIRI